jgi:hypothetical protein
MEEERQRSPPLLFFGVDHQVAHLGSFGDFGIRYIEAIGDLDGENLRRRWGIEQTVCDERDLHCSPIRCAKQNFLSHLRTVVGINQNRHGLFLVTPLGLFKLFSRIFTYCGVKRFPKVCSILFD